MHAIVNKLLTKVSQAIVPIGFVADTVFTKKSVVQYTGLIARYGNDHLRIVTNITGGKNGYMQVETTTRTSDSYSIKERALKDVLTKEDYANVEDPFDAERESVEFLTKRMLVIKEKGIADTLTSLSTYDATNRVTLSGTAQFNDYDNSDPYAVFSTAFNAVRDDTGMIPDVAYMDWRVFNKLKNHPAFIDRVKYVQNPKGGLSAQEMASALDLRKIHVAGSVYNNSKLGQVDDITPIWGKHIVLMISPEQGALMQMTMGYDLTLAGGGARTIRKVAQDEPVGSNKIMITESYDHIITNADAGYLIEDAIA